MTKPDIHSVVGDEGAALAGALAPSSRSGTRRREPVILIHRAFPPPPLGSEGAITSEEGFESLGVIAVRLISEWSLPKCSMRGPASLGRGEEADPLTD
jgi:hypothetical protein